MRLNLFQQPHLQEARVDIYYTQLTPALNQIILLARGDAPRLEGKLGGERVLVLPQDIYYVDTVDRNTFLYQEKEVYQVDMTLREFLEAFEGYGFARVNKSQIVNLHRVCRIRPTAGMRIMAQLENGEKLVINRSFCQEFESALRALGRNHEKVDK